MWYHAERPIAFGDDCRTRCSVASRSWCALESPSRDKPALDALAALLAGRLHDAGASVEVVPNSHGGDHLLARFSGPAERRPALVLGHFDTVWPRGTLERMPFRLDEPAAPTGPASST